ncbi:hypothetical protein [Dactylosporangium sp. NPDC050588]|uniref:hypothetical protein n=1 Tax=Dactylosporangium sp. NPDC050588 TaxID=3157211 RepID=UPI0033CB0865
MLLFDLLKVAAGGDAFEALPVGVGAECLDGVPVQRDDPTAGRALRRPDEVTPMPVTSSS